VTAAHVHSLLHVNLNTGLDVAEAGAFYENVLAQSVAMRTTPEPTDGAPLGVEGQTTTEVWFYYDARGPRSAPAIELLQWFSPAPTGQAPGEPQHCGLAAVGYVVPSTEVTAGLAVDQGAEVAGRSDAWPLRDRLQAVVRLRDLDGVAVEVYQGDVETARFSHLRLNVRDLDASIAWYDRIGLALRARHDDVELDETATGVPGGALVSVGSVGPVADPSLSIELTAWSRPSVTGAPISPANHVGLYRIALGVDDATAAAQALAAEGLEVPEPRWVPLPGTRLGGVHVLFLRDPDGTVVELVQRPRSAMTGRPQATT
jgi:catechol 2,3-dioxygenase-like lactoylglutathione lyase family enzyme